MSYTRGIAFSMEVNPDDHDGLRARKRRETLRRITETAIKLFLANGYDATTLDAIAEAAGIARRTFFHYFKSKEEILLSWQDGLPDGFRALLQGPARGSPLTAVRRALFALVADFRSEYAASIDKILRSTEQLRACNQAKYLRIELAAFEALCELWPETERRETLRIAAMIAAGTLRLSIDAWSSEGGTKPLTDYVETTFAIMIAESIHMEDAV